MRRPIQVRGHEVQVLKVPWYSQDDVEYTCFVCSLKMCLEFFHNVYENQVIRERTPSFSINRLMELTHTRRYTGTPLDPARIRRLGMHIPFDVELEPDCSLSDIDKSLQKALPVIVIYDTAFPRIAERGPAHAGVVVGLTLDRDVILNNPWYGAEVVVDRLDFERGWELQYDSAVFFTPIPQTKLSEWSEGVHA